MNFGEALQILKQGGLVARAGWNGKRMFIFMRPGDTLKTSFIPQVKSLPESVKKWIDENIDDKVNPGETGLQNVVFTPYLCMKAADNSIVNGWLASQTDMLSEDWEIVPSEETNDNAKTDIPAKAADGGNGGNHPPGGPGKP
jgi:hypothetical protein